MNKPTPKEELIKRLENTFCAFKEPEKECLEDVERAVAWFDLTEEEKKEVVNHFQDGYPDKWAGEMIQDVFKYVAFKPEFTY